MLVDVVSWVLLAIVVAYVSALFYGMRKGMNEIITALSSIDQRLAHLEDAMTRGDGSSTKPPEA